MNKNLIYNWEHSTQELTNHFIKKYFGNDTENYWVADEVGSVLFVNDYFFDLNTIIDFLRYKYSKDKMFEYYDYQLNCYSTSEPCVNIKHYRSLKNEKRKD